MKLPAYACMKQGFMQRAEKKNFPKAPQYGGFKSAAVGLHMVFHRISTIFIKI